MKRTIIAIVGILLILGLAGVGGALFIFHEFGRGLPDYRQLADYEPPVMTRVYAGDGRLMAEYAIERRVFVPIRAMPKRVIDAFLSAEDKNFYTHPGIDVVGVVRAAITNFRNIGSDRRPVGASTITQQVAKNFLLSNEVSWERKVKEAILAFRIERTFSKQRILELYLNEIYLGYGSYGVAAAALNYFNKSLDQLSIAEAAYLAATPKAPNNYHPIRRPEAARSRRDWVIGRMLEDGAITEDEAMHARSEPLVVRPRADTEFVTADFFAEEVRRELAKRYGDDDLYKGGLAVRTTLDPRLQALAERVLREGLESYDRRHGWRGPLARLPQGADWQGGLAALPAEPGLGEWERALVLGLDDAGADLGLADGSTGRIPLAEMRWARPWLEGQRLGPPVRRPSDVLAVGDVVAAEPVLAARDGKAYPAATYALRQIPEVEGGLVAIDPHTGRVLAMSGGYSYGESQYNRATQATRQPGSAFKPFVYLAALDAGYTPSTLILDAPFVIDQGPGLPKWRPSNYSQEFYGPSTMRLGIEKSRNLMTVRLAQTIGMDRVKDYAERFGVVDNLPVHISMALGAGETTLLRLTTAYAMIVNGGKRIVPTLIDRIQDRDGQTVYRHDDRNCPNCRTTFWTQQPMPEIPDNRPAVTSEATAYQMVSMLQGVVDRGTGRSIREVGRPLAGKTGTTNDSNDAWFLGFSPDLAVGVFVGFDQPKTLGEREQGATVAAPIFRDFMAEALKGQPTVPFRIPPGIRLVRVEANSGRLAQPGDRSVILEAFKPDSQPTGRSDVVDGVDGIDNVETTDGPTTGTGGLY
ncbi:MAG: penicillin-binding protein 1A [Rhodospirillales bacterium]|jgi:penicillin-binding protein 1A|nr:penicillin-binding protein 1A [Rhodospirillales bacterium]